MKLRDYQTHSFNLIRAAIVKTKHVLFVAPCGFGKTVLFCYITKRSFEKGRTVLLIVNRIKLVKQITDTLVKQGVDASIYSGKLGKHHSQVTVATIQSLNSKVPEYDLLIIDEAHSYGARLFKIIEQCNPSKTISFTATPFNNNGFIYGEDKFWTEIVQNETMQSLTDKKFLAPLKLGGGKVDFDVSKVRKHKGEFVGRALNEAVRSQYDKIGDQVADALPRLEGRKKIAWVCTTIDHAEKVFSFLDDAVIIHSGKENEADMWDFEIEDARHIVCVAMISYGYDYAPMDGIVLMRPTRSPQLYVQIVGRVARICEGKKNGLVLDYGGVIDALGHPNDPSIKEKKPQVGLELCPECMEFQKQGVEFCECGFHLNKPEPVKPRGESDYTKNLTTRAHSDTRTITKLEARTQTSKKDNKMLVVSFREGVVDTLNGRQIVKEYITESTLKWKGRQFLKDFLKLDAKPETLEQLAMFIKNNHDCWPTKLKVQKENGYLRAKEVSWGK